MLKKTIAMTVLLAMACGLMAQGVSRQYKDVDGDGLPEVILENEYLQVIVMTGEMPKEIPDPVELPDGRKVPYKYGERFARGGWIYNMIFKPTNRKWFINDITQGEHRHGIPEEFEITERMREVEPGFYEAMKPSVGTGIGPGLCFRNTLKDMKIPAWGMKEEIFDNGEWKAVGKDVTAPAKGWRLTFTHVIDTNLGYGCAYTKVMTLMDGESVLRTHRELANTGEKKFSTSFYTHGFFSQGQTNGVLDHNCWSVIPLCPPNVKGSPFPKDLIDVERSFIHATRPAYYWGAKSYDEVGGNWHACGNDFSKDVFLTYVDRKPEFFRMWNCDMTYSYEPFMVCRTAEGRRIRYIIMGYNKGQKQGIRIGRRNDQAFVQLPFAKFRRILACTAAKYGIRVIFQEESYTSKACFSARDPIPVFGRENGTPSFSGERVSRGLYRQPDGRVINADINGSLNIGCKYDSRIFPEGKDYSYLYGTVKSMTYSRILGESRRRNDFLIWHTTIKAVPVKRDSGRSVRPVSAKAARSPRLLAYAKAVG